MNNDNEFKSSNLLPELDKLRQQVIELETSLAESEQINSILRKNQNHLHKSFNVLGDRAILFDTQGNYFDLLQNEDTSTNSPWVKFEDTPLYEAQSSNFDSHYQVIQEVLETDIEQVIVYHFDDGGKSTSREGHAIPFRSETDERNVLWVSRDITQRKQAEDQLNYHIKFQNLLMSLATEFINLPLDKFDAYINRMLEQIAKFIGTDHSYINRFSDDLTTITRTHSWWNSDNVRKIKIGKAYPTSSLSWMMQRYQRFEPIHITTIDDFPFEASAERANWGTNQSGISVPLVHEGKLIGALGFHSTLVERRWSKETIDLLKIAGQIYINAIERKKADNALVESDRRYRSLLDKAPVSIVVSWIEEDGSLTAAYTNPAVNALIGMQNEGVVGKQINTLINPSKEQRRLSQERTKAYLEGNDPGFGEYILRHDNGTIYRAVRTRSILIDYEGRPALLSIMNDITEQKLAQEAFYESERRYRKLLEKAPVAIVVNWIEEDGSLTRAYANPAVESLTSGLKSDDRGRGLANSTEETRRLSQERTKMLLEGQDPGFAEYTLNGVDGTKTHISTGSILIEYEGKPAFLSIINDITEQKLAQEALRKSEARYRTLLEKSPIAMIVSWVEDDNSLKVAYANPATARLMDIPNPEMLQDEIAPGFGKDWKPDTEYEKLSRGRTKMLLAGHDPGFGEYVINRADGEVSYVSTASILIEYEGKPAILSVMNDITEQRLAEDELKQYRGALEDLVEVRTMELQQSHAQLVAINQELEDFTYTVSHDLRAPLRALNNYSLFIQEDCSDALSSECLEYVEGIAESAQQMETLVVDLLDYSRINHVEIALTNIDVQNLLDELVKRLNLHKDAEVHFPTDLPTIRGKKVRLDQIFSNLLTNAVKFRRVDTMLEITVTWEENSEHWIFSVIDNGIGIKQQHKEKIFGIFQRLHKQEDYDGTGIGLAIVEKAVKEHKGHVTVRSELGIGTTFTFTISKNL